MSLLPCQPRAIVHSLECPSQQQGVQSAFSQAGNPSLSAISFYRDPASCMFVTSLLNLVLGQNRNTKNDSIELI